MFWRTKRSKSSKQRTRRAHRFHPPDLAHSPPTRRATALDLSHLFTQIKPHGRTLDEEDVSDKPAWPRRQRLSAEAIEKDRHALPALALARQSTTSWSGSFGVKKSGQLANTHCFMSDNGFHGRASIDSRQADDFEEDIASLSLFEARSFAWKHG